MLRRTQASEEARRRRQAKIKEKRARNVADFDDIRKQVLHRGCPHLNTYLLLLWLRHSATKSSDHLSKS